jgi:tetratricopeptide (TPR) repeat protein
MARRRKSRLIQSVVLLIVGGGLIAGAAALAALPRDASANERRALALWNAGDVEGALGAWDQAIAQTPADGERGRARRFELLTRRGECNLIEHRPKNALKDFEEAKALRPGESIAWERVGKARLELGQFQEAALHFDEAAKAFPDRERFFRFAAGCADYSASEELLDKGQELLEARMQPGRHEELTHALERFASTAERPPTREEIEQTLLVPPHGTSEREKAFTWLLDARARFAQADQKLADYETAPELDPAFGRVRLEMHLHAGRYYELRRTAEILLKIAVKPEQAGELLRMRTALANGFHELELWPDAARTFATLRKGFMEAGEPDSARRTVMLEIEERLRARQGKEAMALLPVLGNVAPTSLVPNFLAGFARYLATTARTPSPRSSAPRRC